MNPHSMSKLSLLTWNVCGIGSQAKRAKVFGHLSKLQADICLLQETHLSASDHNKIKFAQYNHVFSANYNTVCILIHKKISFVQNAIISDPEGRYIIINISINNSPITIGNVYGPNSDDPAFFQSFFSAISNMTDCLVTITDFNTILDPSMDYSENSKSKQIWQSTSTIKQFMGDLGLAHSWRIQHPFNREYSFFFARPPPSNITQSIIHPIIIRDHAPVTINWSTNQTHRTTPRWRFKTSLLQDPHFDSLKRKWAFFLEMNDSPESSPSLLWETEKNQKETQLEQKIKHLQNTNMTNPSVQSINPSKNTLRNPNISRRISCGTEGNAKQQSSWPRWLPC